MPVEKGKNSDAKRILLFPDDIEGDDTLLFLTDRHRDLLLVLSEYMDWKSRWANLPAPLDDDDSRDEYVSDIKRRLMEVVNFCERMINCITTDTDTQNAIKALLLNLINSDTDIQAALQQNVQQGLTDENPVGETAAGSNLLIGVSGCAYSNLNGAVLSLIDWLNRNNEDFLDNLSVAATPAERGAAMSKGIKGYNGGALGEVASTAITFLTSQMVNQYDAFYDVAYEHDLAEEMFCLFKTDCEITIRQLYLLFAARVGYATPAETFYEGFLFAVTGSWTGTNFCDVMMFIQLGAFIHMGGFAGWDGLNPLSNAIIDGWNEPNDDWMTEYECGDFWTHILHADDFPAIATFPPNNWGSITGEVITQSSAVFSGQDVTGIYIDITFPSIQNIAGVKISATNLANIEGSSVVNTFYSYLDAGLVPIGGTGGGLPISNDDWEVSYTEVTPGVKKITIQYLFIGLTQTAQFEVIISGFGTNPFL